MPVVLRKKGYAFSFYASDREEPQHIHVRKGRRKNAKFWLTPVVVLEKTRGFRPHELNEAERIIHDHLDFLRAAWDEFFSE